MAHVLCLTDSLNDVSQFVKGAKLLFFPIEQLEPEERRWAFFEEIYQNLKESTDLTRVNLIIAEYVEAVPLVYLMRKDGYFCPAIFIPHTNPYPFDLLFYFLLVSQLSHPEDVILCGSSQAVKGYQTFVNIKSLPSCTFGIKHVYQKGDKAHARKLLNLPEKDKLLLYTGRFMNDKGLAALLKAYQEIRRRLPSASLLLSVNHIDPDYFNQLASQMRHVIFLLFRATEDGFFIPKCGSFCFRCNQHF